MMTLRELLDDTIMRLGLCDRVEMLAVRKFLDGIEAQRTILQAQGLADRLEPEQTRPGPSDFACTACGKTMARYDDFEEYQHDGCGGLVERRTKAPAEFSAEHHLTPAGGADPYEELRIDHGDGIL